MAFASKIRSVARIKRSVILGYLLSKFQDPPDFVIRLKVVRPAFAYIDINSSLSGVGGISSRAALIRAARNARPPRTMLVRNIKNRFQSGGYIKSVSPSKIKCASLSSTYVLSAVSNTKILTRKRALSSSLARSERSSGFHSIALAMRVSFVWPAKIFRTYFANSNCFDHFLYFIRHFWMLPVDFANR